MSFNFNWSPLIADTSRAKEMLTAALNKSPKPPIIVDDIIVSELNLGETPPDLEILEIGDLAEDRFRGIFKMAYSGDAYLTLRTRVQANPLNTYLSTKPDWTNPSPLAAASGLTIPLAITLSDIRLSGFVILVFSKNKGMTLVFRNDPLESLKVSSTFDSIPFVRDYLQREIEKQLRNLFMEDLPAILHRLSLRLWSPEYRELDDRLMEKEQEEASAAPVDPLASPPQDPAEVWVGGEVPSFSLDPENYHASFSQKNLLRLAALNDSHRTLSLFTPPVRDAVFRAWAGASERGSSGMQTPLHATIPTLSRAASQLGSAASEASGLSDPASEAMSRTSTSYTFHGTTGRYSGRPRKAKKRVINLRRSHTAESIADDTNTEPSSTPDTSSIAPSSAPSVIYEERLEDQLQSPPRTPLLRHRRHRASSVDETPRASMLLDPTTNVPVLQRPSPKKKDRQREKERGEEAPPEYTPPEDPALLPSTAGKKEKPRRPALRTSSTRDFAPQHHHSASSELLRTLSSERLAFGSSASNFGSLGAPFSPPSEASASTSSGGILEQAWLGKIARDIARKVEEERRKQEERSEKRSSGGVLRGGGEEMAPPAYAV
jgi:distribution and morphology protein 34